MSTTRRKILYIYIYKCTHVRHAGINFLLNYVSIFCGRLGISGVLLGDIWLSPWLVSLLVFAIISYLSYQHMHIYLLFVMKIEKNIHDVRCINIVKCHGGANINSNLLQMLLFLNRAFLITCSLLAFTYIWWMWLDKTSWMISSHQMRAHRHRKKYVLEIHQDVISHSYPTSAPMKLNGRWCWSIGD